MRVDQAYHDVDEIEADFDILAAIGAIHDELTQAALAGGGPIKTLLRWIAGHREPPQDDAEKMCLYAMTVDLEHFTPSLSGSTAMDRHLRTYKPKDELDHAAIKALAQAQFRLVRIEGQPAPSLVELKDLVSDERLVLLNDTIAPLGSGLVTAMRLCPLASGRQVLISPRFLLDDRLLALALKFVKPGRPLGLGYRCAAALYREIARTGFIPMPLNHMPFDSDAVEELIAGFLPAQQMALQLLSLDPDDPEARADCEADIRKDLAVEDAIDTFGLLAQMEGDAPPKLRAAYERLAEIAMETMALRERAGLVRFKGALDAVASALDGHIAQGDMKAAARHHFDRLRARLAFAGPAQQAGEARGGLDRAIQRILGLRAKTVEQGCTEQEALAAAAKVAELLERYDLTLDEITLRQASAESVTIETSRRGRAAIQDCVSDIAAFCDCRVWHEKSENGTTYVIYFGLKADVEAARFLHGTIETMFETESAAFRRGAIYRSAPASGRRLALKSFRLGLGRGIGEKLCRLADERHARARQASTSRGFDLVTRKQAALDEEIEKLGLAFTMRKSRASWVHGASYDTGKATGALFEPHQWLSQARR